MILRSAPLNVGWSIIRRALLELSGIREHEYRAISRSQNDLGRTAFLVLQRAPASGGVVVPRRRLRTSMKPCTPSATRAGPMKRRRRSSRRCPSCRRTTAAISCGS